MGKKQIADVLIEARRLIEKPENWCQGAFAEDASGHAARLFDENASRFCVRGAIARVVGQEPIRARSHPATELFSEVIGGVSIGVFNDFSSHRIVMAALDQAIAKARAAA